MSDERSGATSWMRGAIVKQRGSSKNHILTHSKHDNCSLHWQRKTDPWARLHEAQGSAPATLPALASLHPRGLSV
jgi:hypothetical protein